MTEFSMITEALRELGLRYGCEDEIIRVSRKSIRDKFPDDDPTVSETKCKAYLTKKLELQVRWSVYDDDWLALDKINPI